MAQFACRAHPATAPSLAHCAAREEAGAFCALTLPHTTIPLIATPSLCSSYYCHLPLLRLVLLQLALASIKRTAGTSIKRTEFRACGLSKGYGTGCAVGTRRRRIWCRRSRHQAGEGRRRRRGLTGLTVSRVSRVSPVSPPGLGRKLGRELGRKVGRGNSRTVARDGRSVGWSQCV